MGKRIVLVEIPDGTEDEAELLQEAIQADSRVAWAADFHKWLRRFGNGIPENMAGFLSLYLCARVVEPRYRGLMIRVFGALPDPVTNEHLNRGIFNTSDEEPDGASEETSDEHEREAQ